MRTGLDRSRHVDMDAVQIDAFLAAVLRGRTMPVPWPAGLGVEPLLRRARYHGIGALLNERLPHGTDWPPELVRAIRDETRQAAMWKLRHQQVLTDLLAALAGRGVRPLLFKGTALAYDRYANPVWRMRAGTDLLVDAGDLAPTREVLPAFGFRRDLDAGGHVVTHAEGWTLQLADGSRHAIDLHRRLAAGGVPAGLLDHAELEAASRPLPRLAAPARGLGPVHALLLACLHRAKHAHSPYWSDGEAHLGGDRLVWLHDIHLLAGTLGDDDRRALITTARAKGLAAVCRDGLAATAARLGTPLAPALQAALDAGSDAEPVATYLRTGRLRALALDLRAVDGTADRLRHLREPCLPPATYMRAKYAAAPFGWLPWLYARRAVEGVRERL